MSQTYDNTNRAILFPNQRKQSDKHPDLTGTLNIDGKEHFFDAWIRWDGDQIKNVSCKIGNAKTGGKSGGNSGQRSAPRQRQELGSDSRRSGPPLRSAQHSDDYDDSDSIPF